MLGLLWCKSQLAKAWPGQARTGLARLERVVFGMVLQGPAIVADGSTELRKKFPAALFREWSW